MSEMWPLIHAERKAALTGLSGPGIDVLRGR